MDDKPENPDDLRSRASQIASYPLSFSNTDKSGLITELLQAVDDATTDLRDRFAGKAITGILAFEGGNSRSAVVDAKVSYAYADAMLAARAKS